MIVIADSGSTSTDWRIIDGGDTLGLRGNGINPFFMTGEQIVDELKSGELARYFKDVNEIHFYGAGLANESVKGIMRKAFEQVFRNAAGIFIEDDLLAASRALFKSGSGIACILGTGSNSCLYRDGEIADRVPALGYILGDEGSGARLGINFINALLKRQLPEKLSRKIIDDEGLSMDKVLENVYRRELPNRYLASITKIIHANLEYGEVRDIVSDSFRDFYARNISRYDNHENYEIGFVGSIAWYFRDLLEEELNKHGLYTGKIIKAPIDDLVDYHTGPDR